MAMADDRTTGYRNECDLGVALKESKLSRSEFYVCTKVMHRVDDISAALRASLKKLQLDYVDLYLIHAPYFADDGTGGIAPEKLQAAWKTMESLKKEGLTKSIGVSNYLPEHLEHTIKGATVIPSVNQIEYHPYLPRTTLVAANKKHGIVTAAYGPLTPVTKAAPGPLDATLASLAKKYAVSESEILLRWAIDRDVIAVTTSGKEQRLSDYLRVATFKLTPAEVKWIEGKFCSF
jgi:diketogulonate reductase-like aldo/keto reductase